MKKKTNEAASIQRMAVYCRVSGDRPVDDSAYILQRQYYEEKVPDKKRALMQFVEELKSSYNENQSSLIHRFADNMAKCDEKGECRQ